MRTADELFARILQDENFWDQLEPAVAERITNVVQPMAPQRAQNLVDRARPFTQGRVRKHRYDVLAGLVVVLIVVGVWRDYRTAPPAQAVLKSGLLPFHVIGAADVVASCKTQAAATQKELDSLVGRYPLTYLEPCQAIDGKKLSAGLRLGTELQGRLIVRLKLQTSSVFAGVNPPFKATLMAAPPERGNTALLLKDVFVLDLQQEKDGSDAVVAIPAEDQLTFSSFLARSNFFLIAGT